jgi:hypothetical protein
MAGEEIRRRKPEIRTEALQLPGMNPSPCTTVSVLAVEILYEEYKN